jgi:microcystin-dependent protein
MVGRWLTPDIAPGEVTCRALFIPDDPVWIATVAGALIPLTFPYNFEPYGTATPAEAAEIFRQMFDNFSFDYGVCRVVVEIETFAGSTNPNTSQWLPCDGASLLRATYTDLFTVIGTTYGSVDSDHFNVPDLRGRAPIGAGHGSGLTDRPLGTTLGDETITLNTSEMPAHTHTDTGHNHTEVSAVPSVTSISPGVPEPTAVPGIAFTGTASANLSNTGGGDPHDNMQPSIALNYFIVAIG